MEYPSYNVNTPQWREITVGSHLPMELGKLAEIARNLWWTWNDDAKSMYCDLDPELWEETEQNPILFLERMNYEKLVTLAHDEFFIRKMNTVYTAFKEYINVVPAAGQSFPHGRAEGFFDCPCSGSDSRNTPIPCVGGSQDVSLTRACGPQSDGTRDSPGRSAHLDRRKRSGRHHVRHPLPLSGGELRDGLCRYRLFRPRHRCGSGGPRAPRRSGNRPVALLQTHKV